MAIKIDDVELKGESYLTIDKTGCWLWENVLPILDNTNNSYKLPVVKKDEDFGMRDWNTVGYQAVKIMLNLKSLDFNFGHKVFNGDTPRIFKLTVSELENK